MILIHMVIAFALIFIAGMHWAVWDNFKEKSSIFWCIVMGLAGLFELIVLIGVVASR